MATSGLSSQPPTPSPSDHHPRYCLRRDHGALAITNEQPAAGWYPDPHEPHGALRWWDGTAWTEDVHLLGATARGAITGVATSASNQAQAPTGHRTASDHVAAAASAGSPTAKVPKVVLWVTAVILLMAVLGAGLLSFGAAVSEQQTSIGTLEAGHVMTFRVTRNGSWHVEFDAPAGRLVVDVRGQDGFDPTAGLVDVATGQQMAFHDDRGAEGVIDFSGGQLDALIDVELHAGRYRLVVEGWSGQAGNGQVQFPVVGSRQGDGDAPSRRR